MLTGQQNISQLQINGQQATFKLDGDQTAQNELLKHLLQNDLSVCEFSSVTTNLQDAYLQTVKQ